MIYGSPINKLVSNVNVTAIADDIKAFLEETYHDFLKELYDNYTVERRSISFSSGSTFPITINTYTSEFFIVYAWGRIKCYESWPCGEYSGGVVSRQRTTSAYAALKHNSSYIWGISADVGLETMYSDYFNREYYFYHRKYEMRQLTTPIKLSAGTLYLTAGFSSAGYSASFSGDIYIIIAK